MSHKHDSLLVRQFSNNISSYDVCQCRDEHWKEGTYDKDEHVKVIRAAATALFERYTKDSLGKKIWPILYGSYYMANDIWTIHV